MNKQAQFLAQPRFGSLDGLRALSILAVVWHHTVPSGLPPALSHAGAHGVTLFFAISGFLITTLLLAERARTGMVDLLAFYIRRALRIFPLYYLVLAVYVVAVALLERDAAARQAFFHHLPYFATYTSNFFVALEGRTIFYFAWSLATEEQFYLLWPPLLVWAGVARSAWPLGLLVAACAVDGFMGSNTLAVVPLALVGGAMMAIALRHPRGWAWLHPVLGAPGAPLAWAAVLVWAAVADVAPTVHLAATGLVGACVLRESHALSGVLQWRPLVHLGVVSYGIYLLHMLCKNLAQRLLAASGWGADSTVGPWLLPLATLALAVGAATLSFRTFEAWFLRRKPQRVDDAPPVALPASAV
jgi:peptidoglycan/LPS O-acetylase OafA/YrhL